VKLLVDTNTLVSGTLWTGAPSRLIEAIEQERANVVLSAALLAEFGDVVGRQEFGFVGQIGDDHNRVVEVSRQ
jgi:uncharacterized protein